ncbi:solute carrier family 7 member 12-like isoform X2 [Rattus norvegicus]|uniref:solute carrier family 7 member 12-like isoform X2 n=1 Tax=Rattus norvegicus TaxID=10116 RepID=UPI0003D07DB4|eukprot:XP_006232181.1 PREDICTED: solute carrier family 7 member 13-like isoform X2 [Rattus norvegicus]
MRLSRTVGFFHVTMVLLGTIIGTGIFVSPKGVLKYSSLNIPVSLGIWAGCGLLVMLNALSLVELATTFPVSGASYYFLKRSLGSLAAFLSLWIQLFSYCLGLGAHTLLIATYLIQPFYTGCPAPELPIKCLSVAILWSFGILNAGGVKTVAWLQTISSMIKMSILCFISLTGLVLLVIGKKENVSKFENALDAELPNASQTVEAILQGCFAYRGIFIVINIADSVVITWVNRAYPSMQWVMSLGISLSSLTTTACGILSAARICYSASLEGQMPFIFSMLNNHQSPVVAVTQVVILSTVSIICSNLTYLIKYLGIMSIFNDVLYMIAILKLRYQKPALPRPYKVCLPLVFGSLALSSFFILAPIIQSPNIEHIYEGLFLLSGFVVYWLQVYLYQHADHFKTITCYLQLLFNVLPSDEQDKNLCSE